MSIRLSLFKTKKPRQFEYKPLYHDPVKEELMQRVNAIKKEQAAATCETEVEREARISRAFREKRSARQSAASGVMKNQTFRIVIIAAVLASIAYALLK